MKRVILVAPLLLAVVAVAQQAPQPPKPAFQSNLVERAQAPTYSDIYCSGFVTNENINEQNAVAGGVNSPNETLYGTGAHIFINGSGFQEGALYSIVRPVRDPNHYEPFAGQKSAISAMGETYADIGRIRVVALRGSMAVAEVEFTCQSITVGDFAIPFREHGPVAFRKNTTMERFPSGPGRVSARIVLAREFDTMVGTGQKVYINAGADKGIKVGDYFRAVRGNDPAKIDPVDATAMKAPVGDDTQVHAGKVNKAIAAQMPLRNLGQMIVLNVTPTSSTAMITNALEPIQVGDQVELENEGGQ
ncbi:MAG TPA: hypothetical protein VN577_06595 [Terriglobales bacterium]|nr:hypothetical protein [Terriglobales bacterium]